MLKRCLTVCLIGAALAGVLAQGADFPAARASQSIAALFAFDSDELDAEARRDLDALLARFEPHEIEKVILIAHADRIGRSHYNLVLSEQRLLAVHNYLADKGITLQTVHGEARGADQPFTSGYCEDMGPENRDNAVLIECLQADRRVDIEVVGVPRELERTAKRGD
jgi:OmpA-OmpF porin, OOP family